jgi:S-(hydroxymethyl)glutathione dehydrogenase/alcohol dehydrogenase
MVFGLGGIGLNVIQGARMVGAEHDVGVDMNPSKKEWGKRFGMTHFVNPKEVDGDLVAHLVELTGGGADYSFECIGNTDTMRRRWNAAHKGWGESIIIGVAGAGRKSPPARSSWSPAGLARHGLWRREGPDRRAEDRRLVHGREDRDRPDDHPHHAAGRHQQGAST